MAALRSTGELLTFGKRSENQTVFVSNIPLSLQLDLVRTLLEAHGSLEYLNPFGANTETNTYSVVAKFFSSSAAKAAVNGLDAQNPWPQLQESLEGMPDESDMLAHAWRPKPTMKKSFESQFDIGIDLLPADHVKHQFNMYMTGLCWSNSIEVIEVHSTCAKRRRVSGKEASHLPVREMPSAGPEMEMAAMQSRVRAAAAEALARRAKSHAATLQASLAQNATADNHGLDDVQITAAAAAHRLEELDNEAVPIPAILSRHLAEEASVFLAQSGTHEANRGGAGDMYSDSELAGACPRQRFFNTESTLFEDFGLSAARAPQELDDRVLCDADKEAWAAQERVGTGAGEGTGLDSVFAPPQAHWAYQQAIEDSGYASSSARCDEGGPAIGTDPAAAASQEARARMVQKMLKVPDLNGFARANRQKPKQSVKQSMAAQFPSLQTLAGTEVLKVFDHAGRCAAVSAMPPSTRVKAPCVFVRQMIHVHNPDGTTVTSVASAGCSCRHRTDGLSRTVVFTSAPEGHTQGVGQAGDGAGAVAQAMCMIAPKPPSRYAAEPLAPLSQQLTQEHAPDEGAASALPAEGKKRSAKRRRILHQDWTAEHVLSGRPMLSVATEAMRYAANRLQLWVPHAMAQHGAAHTVG